MIPSYSRKYTITEWNLFVGEVFYYRAPVTKNQWITDKIFFICPYKDISLFKSIMSGLEYYIPLVEDLRKTKLGKLLMHE